MYVSFRTWLNMLCLSERGDEDLFAVARGPEVTVVVGRRREPYVARGPEIGVVAVIEIIHAENIVRLKM